MGKFDKLKAIPKKVVIGGEEFLLKPLSGKNLDAFMKTANDDKPLAVKDIVNLTIKESYPDEEFDIDEISIEFIEELAKAVLEVNNLKVAPREE